VGAALTDRDEADARALLLTRRAMLGGSLGAAATLALQSEAQALGRVPIGGRVSMRVPWSTRRIDPHDLFDPLAAIFGAAFADTVFARDQRGNVYPTLADGMPFVEGDQTVVRLRPGLRSGRGKTMGGRDLAWSVMRARKRGAVGLLAPLTPWVRSDKDQPLIARFGQVDPGKLAMLLSSPLLALLPVGFSATAPDGTGPFVASCSAGRLELVRNRNASRGPAFLERVIVRSARDLAASLRAFESGHDDLGWLGLGFHQNRPDARKFDYRDVGWVVLATGKSAGSFGAPGVAQQLANSVPVERLHVGLRRRVGIGGATQWSGGPAALLYEGGASHLKEVAEAVAAKLSQPGHEITPTPVSRGLLRRARRTGGFVLALDVVRDPRAGPASALIALATADREALGKDVALHPPRTAGGQAANRLTATLRVGVLGGLAVHGGVIRKVLLAATKTVHGIDWGASYRSP